MNTQTTAAPVATLPAVQNFIFDLDGVVWRGNAPIDGAVEALAELKAAGKRCLYCTNNSRKEPAEYAETLRRIGIDANEEDVMTSSLATSIYIQSQYTGPFSAYVIGEAGLVNMLRRCRTGAIVTVSPIIPQRSDLHGMHGAVDCVVVGIDATFSYHKMRVAQRLIMDGASFIATNRDTTFPTPHGLVPGAGAIVASIESCTGISPIVLGKPQPLMLQLLMQQHGLKPEETAMVGDRVDTDIAAGHRAGIRGFLVTTGVHTSAQGRRAKGEQRPDGIYDDLSALCNLDSDREKVAGAVASGISFDTAPVAAETHTEAAQIPAPEPFIESFEDSAQPGNANVAPAEPVTEAAAGPLEEATSEPTAEAVTLDYVQPAAPAFSGFSLAPDSRAPQAEPSPEPQAETEAAAETAEPEAASEPEAPAEHEPAAPVAVDSVFDTGFAWLDDDMSSTSATNGAAPVAEAEAAPVADTAAADIDFGDDFFAEPAAETATEPAPAGPAPTQPVAAAPAPPAPPAPAAPPALAAHLEPPAEGAPKAEQNGAATEGGEDNWWESLDNLV